MLVALDLEGVLIPEIWISFAEKTGTYTNIERRVHKLRKAIGTSGDADEDWRVIANLASRLGNENFKYSDSSDIFSVVGKKM